MSRTLFANANGLAPQRSHMCPYGFPWLPQQGKRATDAVTINAAILLVLAFAAMTQKNTAVLTTSEEHDEVHFGEPCSWWQTAEVKHSAKLGATTGASCTCESARRWSQGNIDKPGSWNHDKLPLLRSSATVWPMFNAKKECFGAVVTKIPMQIQAQGFAPVPSNNETNTRSSMCRILALPRLPEEKGCFNVAKADRRTQSSKVPVERPTLAPGGVRGA